MVVTDGHDALLLEVSHLDFRLDVRSGSQVAGEGVLGPQDISQLSLVYLILGLEDLQLPSATLSGLSEQFDFMPPRPTQVRRGFSLSLKHT
jgi:hypothetical protein